jgi:SHAQKYF class myb-like DNA-binding protein
MTSASGQWSSNEHLLFEKACVLFGWGRWKDITNWMGSQGCGRSRDQVKSHAQKFAQARPHERKRIGMMIHNPRREKRTPSKMSTEKEVVLTPMTASMATALMNLKHTFVSTPNIFSPE